jgi:hypothetical protein
MMQYFVEDISQPSPDLTMPLGGGVPDSLDIEQWYVFLQLPGVLSSFSEADWYLPTRVSFFGLGGSPADETNMFKFQ